MDAADEELMLAYRDGDVRAFEVLYARHKNALYRYLLRQCRVAAIAEELFQDIWINLIKARERYRPSAKFTTYLFRVAHNRLIDYYRHQSSGLPMSYDGDLVVEDLPDTGARETEYKLDMKRHVKRLLSLIAALPEAQRETFLMREEGGLSLEEIADATDVNIETAKSRLRYAVAKLREGMGEMPPLADPPAFTPEPGEEAESW